MKAIGQTIRTKELKGVVIYEYIGVNYSYKKEFEGYLSIDNSKPSFKNVIDKQYNETCLVIIDDSFKEHHVFASSVISFNEDNYQKFIILEAKKEKALKEDKEQILKHLLVYANKVCTPYLTPIVIEDFFEALIGNEFGDLAMTEKYTHYVININTDKTEMFVLINHNIRIGFTEIYELESRQKRKTNSY